MKKILLILSLLSCYIGFSQQRIDIAYRPIYIINDLQLDTLADGSNFFDSTFIIKIPSNSDKFVINSIGYNIDDTVTISLSGTIDIDSISSYTNIETIQLTTNSASYFDCESIYPYIVGTINSISSDTTNSGHIDIIM